VGKEYKRPIRNGKKVKNIIEAKVSESLDSERMEVAPHSDIVIAQSIVATDHQISPINPIVKAELSSEEYDLPPPNAFSLLTRMRNITIERFIHTFEGTVALIFAGISVAIVYWVVKKVLLFTGIEEYSFKFVLLGNILFFVEIVLILKFLLDQLRKH
jgi:hypothetical protein